MTKRNQIIFAYLFHAVLIVLGFLFLRSYADGFLVSAVILYGVYLIFYVTVNCKTYIPWILLLHHLIGSVAQFFLHYFEIIPPDSGFFSGIGQFIYAFIAVPGYFALLLLAHLTLFIIYKIRTTSAHVQDK